MQATTQFFYHLVVLVVGVQHATAVEAGVDGFWVGRSAI